MLALHILALVGGLALLVWSADKFVDGAAATARHFGVPILLIGMVIVGFGTSAPEMVVSAISAVEGNSGIALGNAYGSNITNIALILGLTALISPVVVHSSILKKELPVLGAVTALTAFLLADASVSRLDGIILLAVFAILMTISIIQGLKNKSSGLIEVNLEEIESKTMPLKKALMFLLIGLVLLVGSSRLLVWGAVEIARFLGVSDLIIGLTVVAIGTSLPELAASIAAIKKGEQDLALGNVIGSNLFNTLTVVGIAGTIRPISVDPEVFNRDVIVMSALTVAVFLFGLPFGRKEGKINRIEGGLLLLVYCGYIGFLFLNFF